MTPLIINFPLAPVELPKTTEFTPVGKEYLCFQVNRNSPHASQCVKSRILNKAIDSILYIDTFEQQCVVIKCMLKYSRLEDNMKTIGIDLSSVARSSFEHRCTNNTKNIYQHAGKCDDQQNFKDILEDALLSTPEEFTDNSPNVHMTSSTVKKPSVRKSLCLFTNILDVKPKTEWPVLGSFNNWIMFQLLKDPLQQYDLVQPYALKILLVITLTCMLIYLFYVVHTSVFKRRLGE